MVDLELYDYRNRAYSPEFGRFLQSDPKSFDADPTNLYRYCGNDPLDRTDPMGLDYSDPYEGSPNRFNPVDVIKNPGGDRYGETHIDRKIGVTPYTNGELRLTKYDVTVGKRDIATKTDQWGLRNQKAIEATKQHEDKHVADAKVLEGQYHNLIGKAVGHFELGQNPDKAAERMAKRLADQFDTKIQSHEPKKEWSDIRKREDDGNTHHRFSSNERPSRFESPGTRFFIQIIH